MAKKQTHREFECRQFGSEPFYIEADFITTNTIQHLFFIGSSAETGTLIAVLPAVYAVCEVDYLSEIETSDKSKENE